MSLYIQIGGRLENSIVGLGFLEAGAMCIISTHQAPHRITYLAAVHARYLRHLLVTSKFKFKLLEPANCSNQPRSRVPTRGVRRGAAGAAARQSAWIGSYAPA